MLLRLLTSNTGHISTNRPSPLVTAKRRTISHTVRLLQNAQKLSQSHQRLRQNNARPLRPVRRIVKPILNTKRRRTPTRRQLSLRPHRTVTLLSSITSRSRTQANLLNHLSNQDNILRNHSRHTLFSNHTTANSNRKHLQATPNVRRNLNSVNNLINAVRRRSNRTISNNNNPVSIEVLNQGRRSLSDAPPNRPRSNMHQRNNRQTSAQDRLRNSANFTRNHYLRNRDTIRSKITQRRTRNTRALTNDLSSRLNPTHIVRQRTLIISHQGTTHIKPTNVARRINGININRSSVNLPRRNHHTRNRRFRVTKSNYSRNSQTILPSNPYDTRINILLLI